MPDPGIDTIEIVGRFAAGACLLVACLLALWIVAATRGADPPVAARHPHRAPLTPRQRPSLVRACALLAALLITSSVLAWTIG